MLSDYDFFRLLLLGSMLGLAGVATNELSLVEDLRYFLGILLHILEALGVASYR